MSEEYTKSGLLIVSPFPAEEIAASKLCLKKVGDHILAKAKEKSFNVGQENLESGCAFGGMVLTVPVVTLSDLELIIKELTT